MKRMCGESWWNCEEDVWGRVGGNVKKICGESWWNYEEDVWGSVGGIVKRMCRARLVEL